MLKKIVMIILLIALAAVAYWYFAGFNKTENTANEVAIETGALNENESKAIDLLKDEIFQDTCKDFAKNEGIKEDELKEYTESCLEELRAEATMVEPGLEGRSPEEIQTQCSTYAKEDKIVKEKLDEYLDLCAKQLRAEDTMVELEGEQHSVETDNKKDAKD